VSDLDRQLLFVADVVDGDGFGLHLFEDGAPAADVDGFRAGIDDERDAPGEGVKAGVAGRTPLIPE